MVASKLCLSFLFIFLEAFAALRSLQTILEMGPAQRGLRAAGMEPAASPSGRVLLYETTPGGYGCLLKFLCFLAAVRNEDISPGNQEVEGAMITCNKPGLGGCSGNLVLHT
jgi:hypothetical protein